MDSSKLEKSSHKPSTGLLIEGCGCSSAIDSSGESIDMDTLDISSLESGDGFVNYEHVSPEEKKMAAGEELVGKIVYAKKIMRRSDCTTDRQRDMWDKIKLPHLYTIARLFDGAGHVGAQALAAIIRDCAANDEPVMLRWSVEGSVLKRDGNILRHCVVRGISLTRKPCNRQAYTSLLEDPNAPKGFDTNPVREDVLGGAVSRLEETSKAERSQQHPMYMRLNEGVVVNGDPRVSMVDLSAAHPQLYKTLLVEAIAKTILEKATCAGSGGAAPSQSVGVGMRPQMEDRALSKHKAKNLMLAALRDYDEPGPFDKAKFRKYLEASMPLVSKPFLDHFEEIAEEFDRARINKAEPFGALLKGMKLGAGDEQQDPAPKQKAPKVPKTLTYHGAPVAPNPDRKKVSFDENTGMLHTPLGSFQAFVPSKERMLPDGRTELDGFNECLSDPGINTFHNYAMEQWSRMHSLLKAGKVPPEAIMHAVLFSQLSPQTPVPLQELMYGHLVDSMRENGVDARSPDFSGIRYDWEDRDNPDTFPKHSNDYFMSTLNDVLRNKKNSYVKVLKPGEVHPGKDQENMEYLRDEYGNKVVDRAAGEIGHFALTNSKFDNMERYHTLHDALTELINKHRGDGRKAVQELMFHKLESEKHIGKRNRAIAAGRPDPGPYLAGPSVPGLAPKTSRYAMGMLGAGNVTVPDTHFTRFMFGLDPGQDGATNDYLKSVLWDENNTEVLNAIDRYFEKNHPAVDHMLVHPKFGSLFADRQDALFPAFWKTWCTISQMEKLRGFNRKGAASNVLVNHRPYWDAIDPYISAINKAEQFDVPLCVRTARMHRQWADHFGEGAALQLYFRHLVPMLLKEAESRESSGGLFKAEDILKEEMPRTKGAVGNRIAKPQPDVKVREMPRPVMQTSAAPPASGPGKKSTSMSIADDGRLVIPSGPRFPRGGHIQVADWGTDPEFTGLLRPDDKRAFKGNGRYDPVEAEYVRRTVHEPFARAMQHWLVANAHLAEGACPAAVIKKAALFAAMSPHTSVPRQEYCYGHLMDMIIDGKLDLNRPITQEHADEFSTRVRSGQMPRWNQPYFAARAARVYSPTMNPDPEEGTEGPEKQHELLQVPGLMHLDDISGHLEHLVATHRDDARSIAANIMNMKAARDPFFPHFGPKLVRYTLAMLGGGNAIVPDRHMLRSVFGLPAGSPEAGYVERNLPKANNEHIMQALDEHFFHTSPLVRHVLDQYPQEFRGRERQAIFPAMWLHWLMVPHYDRRMGWESPAIQNIGTDHQPAWDSFAQEYRHHGVPVPEHVFDRDDEDISFDTDSFDRMRKAESHPMSPHERVLGAMESVRMKHGEIPALMSYFVYGVPFLTAHDNQVAPGAGLRKMEAMTIDLRKTTQTLQAAKQAVVDFRGDQVVPGRAVVPHTGMDYDILHGDRDHYLAVPSSIGATNWEPHHLVKLPRSKEGTHYEVTSQPRLIRGSRTLDASVHGVPLYNNTPEQQALIHGMSIDPSNAQPKPTHAQRGRGQWVQAGNGNLAYMHIDDDTRDEMAFHNVARDFFGLGQHIPTTSMFIHPTSGACRVQEMFPGAEHYEDNNKGHRKLLKALGDSGVLDKLGVLDKVMGIGDRHDGNYVLSKEHPAGIGLIDNTLPFFHFDTPRPFYLREYDKMQPSSYLPGVRKLHPEAAKWALSLNPEALERMLRSYNVKNQHVVDTVDKLREVQDKIQAGQL